MFNKMNSKVIHARFIIFGALALHVYYVNVLYINVCMRYGTTSNAL
jgi:hypothetical protein